MGRSATRTGSRASHEAAVASSPKASIPSAFAGELVETEWSSNHQIAVNESALLYLGDSIPDLPFLIVGTRIGGDEAEKLGYREFAKYGGWLIWHQEGNDFYVLDVTDPLGCIPVDAFGTAVPR